MNTWEQIVNAIKEIFIVLNIKMDCAWDAAIHFILTPKIHAHQNNSDVFTQMEFALAASILFP